MLSSFQQQVANFFDERINYDQIDFHPLTAHRLIEYSQIKPGQKILDLATGTGLVAIEAAKIVGEQGKVIGVDISPGMLQQAAEKIEKLQLKNIEMLNTNAEKLDFPENSFDKLLCCSALLYFSNIPTTLQRWKNLLVSDGLIGLCVFSENAFIMRIVLKKVAAKYGIKLENWNSITGDEDKCFHLLEEAGFHDIKIYSEQFGNYIKLDDLPQLWDNVLVNNPLCQELWQLSSTKLEEFKNEYFAELKSLETKQGIWNDITTFFVLGRK